jgi:hypothetical protein
MQGEISRLYYEYYRFAFDTARKAERTMKQELMRPELDTQDFVKFNYWDGGRKGLLSGEALYLDLKRMEAAYHDNNKRELDIKRDVSLGQLDPVALLTLKSSGACQVTVPEWLYDRDCPGHYMRRISRVAVSVVADPAPTNVYCTLSLLRSSIRKTPIAKNGSYARQGTEDDRFIDYSGAIQSIVTSTPTGDAGVFPWHEQDGRFMPCEGAGAISTWSLELPKDYPGFDYATISDVVLHIEYTARQGVIVKDVMDALEELFQQTLESGPNFSQLFELQRDFPAAWAAFTTGPGPFEATIRKRDFPYFAQGHDLAISGIELYASKVAKNHAAGNPASATTDLEQNDAFVFSAPPDAAEPKVLTRTATTPIFLVVRYALA